MKKNFILLTLSLSLLSMAYAADQGISVESPDQASHWKCGSLLAIQWSKWGDWTRLNQIPGNQKVRSLRRKGRKNSKAKVNSKLRADNVPATSANGTFSWEINTDTMNGEYHVIVETINKLFLGESEAFYIEGCTHLL